jgi:betaine-aldehyde dehydrogenase
MKLPQFVTDQFLAGHFRKGAGVAREIYSPSTGQLLALVNDASPMDLDEAVRGAKAVQREWFLAGPGYRSATLRTMAQSIRDHAAELAQIDTLDTGNPIDGMRFDANLAAALVDYFAGIATEVKGETIPQKDGRLTYVVREPVGVVARLVAFNHPLLFACIKLAAPLAAGNAVIIKPSEETPLASLRIAQLCADIFPKGLVSVLTGGVELGEAICAHPGIGAVGLIGSVNTGRAVMRGAASTIKHTQLELGGKNALVICPDADVDAAVAGAIKGMNFGWTAGQSCGSTSRVLVHESLYPTVVDKLTAAFDSIELGDPLIDGTQMGALSTRGQYEKVTGFIKRALEAGATIPTRQTQQTPNPKGFYVRPTLVTGIDETSEIAREEVFGPVLSVLRWKEEEDAISLVNGLDVGLTASVWTESLDTALRLTSLIEAGYVWVNDSSDHYLGAPFGGVKQSGVGREECLDELLAYTEKKTVTLRPLKT